MAFNFGFDDLVAAESAAGTGANNIIDSYAKRQMDFENLNQALIKNDMDRKIQEMTLPTKIMTENLQNAQKLNLMEPEPTDEHFKKVADVIFPNQDLSQLNEAQLATLDAQARALAKEELPKLDPFNPTTWMKERGSQVVSDQQREWDLESKKLQVALQRESLKQQAALERFLEGQKTKKEEGEKNRVAAKERTNITASTARRNKDVGEAGQYGRQSLKEAQDIMQAIQAKYGSKRFINSRDRKKLAQQINSIEEPSTRRKAETMFAEELAKETKTITPPTSIGQPKNTFIKDGYTYKINPDGSATRMSKAK